MKTAALIIAILFSPAFALACTADGKTAAGSCCTTAGETKSNEKLTDLLACVWEDETQTQAVFKSMLSGVSSGTVAAFSAGTCPTGWTAASYMAGRVAVGAGSGAGLTTRTHGETGGEEKHAQTLQELAPHTHTIGARWSDSGAFGSPPQQDAARFAAGGINAIRDDRTTSQAGSGQAFNVMQPYIVLTYCQKD